MKKNLSLIRHLTAAAALAFLTATPNSSAQTVATDPVGFVTISIAGGGAQGAPVYTFTSLSLLNPVAFQSTTTSVGGDAAVVDSAATWADNQYNSATAGAPPTHYVEIVSGPGAGTTYDITTTNAAAKSVSLATPLLGTIATGASYKIRPHMTLSSVFGATNQNGLSGGDITTADQIQLFRNGGYLTYYYQALGVFGGAGWRKTGDSFADVSTTVIYPDDGILIVRKQGAATSVIIQGAVKTGQTSIPVSTGFSLLGNAYAAATTLGTANLYTGDSATGLAAGDITTADQVMFWNGTGFNTYYYQAVGVFGGAGWRKTGDSFADASATTIPVGAALFVKRAGAAFNWIAPQSPASFN